MIESHTGSVKRFEVLSFLLQDLEAILLNSLIIYQLSLEQAGCGRGENKEKTPLQNQRLQHLQLASLWPTTAHMGPRIATSSAQPNSVDDSVILLQW